MSCVAGALNTCPPLRPRGFRELLDVDLIRNLVEQVLQLSPTSKQEVYGLLAYRPRRRSATWWWFSQKLDLDRLS
jgi:hypothetical protein